MFQVSTCVEPKAMQIFPNCTVLTSLCCHHYYIQSVPLCQWCSVLDAGLSFHRQIQFTPVRCATVKLGFAAVRSGNLGHQTQSRTMGSSTI